MPSTAHLTTPIVWICTAIVAAMDLLLGIVVWRRIKRDQFTRIRGALAIASGIFFLLVWASAFRWGWDWFYAFIFPAWARLILPPVFCLLYTILAFGMGWLSLKLPGKPAINWCILGGLEGLLSHIYAIYSLGAASKPPIMQGSDPLAVLIFAVFEKSFYWTLILLGSWFVFTR